MALPAWQASVTSDTGDVQPGAIIEVRVATIPPMNGSLISLFEDGLGETGLDNPFNADGEGFARFYSEPGRVDIRATTANGVREWFNVVMAPESMPATDVAYNNAESGLLAEQVQAAIDELKANAAWLGTAIGETKHIVIDDTDLYPPDDSALFRYILLTAGEDGAGGYNEGLLINEDIDASYVDGNGHSGLRVTAEIDMPSSLLHGKVIDLINSSGAFIRPGETAGVFEHDQMQLITGAVIRGGSANVFGAPDQVGAFTTSRSGVVSGISTSAGTTDGSNQFFFSSSDSPDARASATTAGPTQPTNTTGVFLLRLA